jgi:YVTN family beta-propeller protein
MISILIASLVLSARLQATGVSDHGKIVVANRGGGTLSLIDASSAAFIKDVPLPAGASPPEPMYVVNTPLFNRVWVGDRANDRVVLFDGRTFKPLGSLPAGDGVFHMHADALGRQLWVVNDLDNTATVIDANRKKVITTVPMPADLIAGGARPHDVVLDPLGLFAYITFTGTDPTQDVIVQFNTWSFREFNRVTVGNFPHVAFNWRTWEVYSPCQNASAVFVLNGLTLGLNDTIDIPGAHGAITSVDSKRFVTTNISGGGTNAVFNIDTRTNEVLDAADTAFPTPHNVALTPSGRLLYVTHSGAASNKVSVVQH